MGAESESHGARPLDPSSSQLSTKVQEALRKGQHSWLKSTEICYLLLHHAALNLKVEKEPPCQPPGKEQSVLELGVGSTSAWSNFNVGRVPLLPGYGHKCRAAGGSLFLFDRKAVRFFRKDKHNWRKKADGKTVRETHEKLKVDEYILGSL